VEQESTRADRRVDDELVWLYVEHFDGEPDDFSRREVLPEITLEETIGVLKGSLQQLG